MQLRFLFAPIVLVVEGVCRSFPSFDALACELGLDEGLSPEERSAILGATLRGAPLHAGIDPYAEEIHNFRCLVFARDANSLDVRLYDLMMEI